MIAPLVAVAVHSMPIDWVVYEPKEPNGKHVVLLAGDEEYRSEEALPQLAKILTFRHGFKCSVLFSINEKGEIDPDVRNNQPGLENLKTADLVVIALRFRQWPDEQMRHFDEYLHSGRPIIALRTSTHAFDIKSGTYEKYGWQSETWRGGFGRHVLGETWVSHWGAHGVQGTRAHTTEQTNTHLVLRGVKDVFVTTDVYEAHPQGATVLLRGEVIDGLRPTDPPARGSKRNSLGREQGVNDPMVPIVWIREYLYEPTSRNKMIVCTMGAATDFLNEGLRRLIVNSSIWLTGLEVPMRADVSLVGEYRPSPFGFGGYKKGVRPGDLALARATP